MVEQLSGNLVGQSNKAPQQSVESDVFPFYEDNEEENSSVPTFCFIGKTGAGKTTLINALAQKQLGSQAKTGQLKSETSAITVHKGLNWMGGPFAVNFVDTPGLMDTEGNDQEILDMMKDEFEKKAPRIDMFVLCFEQGKFDRSIQIMLETYMHLLKDK